MRVIVLGSSGFVGRNLFEDLSDDFDVYGTHRNSAPTKQKSVFFDLRREETWRNVIDLKPEVIVNAAGYGVVKLERDIEAIYDINYRLPASFFDYVKGQLRTFFIQIGSAFEYDLNLGRLTESSPCRPRTHYGISKFMMSQYLLHGQYSGYSIIRPFGMYGPYEHESKLFPYLIIAQRDRKAIELSSGTQVRDYFYVKDLSAFVGALIKSSRQLPSIINVGSNREYSIVELAGKLASNIPHFDEQYWHWDEIKPRENESPIFINTSQLSRKLGFYLTDDETSFIQTVKHYFNGIDRE